MKKEKKLALSKLGSALKTLTEGARDAKTQLEKDGVIQRFEFTFELMWKALKIFLEDEGLLEKTPKSCLSAAYKAGWIEDEEGFLEMLEDRNKTSHIYSKIESDRIFKRIFRKHVGNISTVAKRLAKVV